MMAAVASAEDRKRLATCLRVIAGREIGKIAYDDTMIIVDEGVEVRDAGGVIFAVHGLFEIQAAIGEAERISKQLPRNFFKRSEILTTIHTAKFCLGQSARYAASHLSKGAFTTAGSIALDAHEAIDRDASSSLMALASALELNTVPGPAKPKSPKLTKKDIANQKMFDEYRRNPDAMNWSLREWETHTGVGKDTCKETDIYKLVIKPEKDKADAVRRLKNEGMILAGTKPGRRRQLPKMSKPQRRSLPLDF